MTDQKYIIKTVNSKREERVEVLSDDDNEDLFNITLEFSKNGLINQIAKKTIDPIFVQNDYNTNALMTNYQCKQREVIPRVFGFNLDYMVLHELDNTELINNLYNLQANINDCNKKLKNLMDKNSKSEDSEIKELKEKIAESEIKLNEIEKKMKMNLEYNLGNTDQERTRDFAFEYEKITKQFKDDRMYLRMVKVLNKKVTDNFFKFGNFIFNKKKYQTLNDFNPMYFYLYGKNYFVCTKDEKVYFVNLGEKVSNTMGLPTITKTPEIYFIDIVNDNYEITAYKKPYETADWNKFPDNIVGIITFV